LLDRLQEDNEDNNARDLRIKSTKVIFDSGSPYIVVPRREYETLYREIRRAGRQCARNRLSGFDVTCKCSSVASPGYPMLALHVGSLTMDELQESQGPMARA